jgi:hypothetical protein
MARAVVEIFNLRPEEESEAFSRIYEACKAGLISYEEKAGRMSRRLTPGRN